MGDRTARRNVPERRLAGWAAALWLTVAAHAAAAAEREHAAHVHGVARLDIAQEGGTVEMELVAPGADIVGFEHAPESAADKAAVKTAAAALENGAGLFAFPPQARCRLDDAEVRSDLLEHDGDEGEESGHSEEGESDEHAEFQARYRFQCERPDDATHLDLSFFELFPSAEVLNVQTSSPRGQSAQQLTPMSMRLKF